MAHESSLFPRRSAGVEARESGEEHARRAVDNWSRPVSDRTGRCASARVAIRLARSVFAPFTRRSSRCNRLQPRVAAFSASQGASSRRGQAASLAILSSTSASARAPARPSSEPGAVSAPTVSTDVVAPILVKLRWHAIVGQVITIAVGFGVDHELPLARHPRTASTRDVRLTRPLWLWPPRLWAAFHHASVRDPGVWCAHPTTAGDAKPASPCTRCSRWGRHRAIPC